MKNYSLDSKKFSSLHKDERQIIEGLVQTYEKFGGLSLILEPKEKIKSLTEDDRLSLIKLAQSPKTHLLNNQESSYINEETIFEYYSFHEYDNEAKKLLEKFKEFHITIQKLKNKYESNVLMIASLKDSLIDDLKENIQENFNKIEAYYKTKEPELAPHQIKLQYAKDMKSILKEIDPMFPDDRYQSLVNKSFHNLLGN